MILGQINSLSVKFNTRIFEGMQELGCQISKNLEGILVPKSHTLLTILWPFLKGQCCFFFSPNDHKPVQVKVRNPAAQ